MFAAHSDEIQHAHALVLAHLRELRSDVAVHTNNELLVLGVLWTEGDTGFGTLAADVGMTAGGLSALVNRLERAGLVVRYRDDPDFRRVLVALTEDGLALMDETAERTSSADHEDASRSRSV